MSVNQTAWETPCAKLNQINVNAVFHIIFTLFSIHEQIRVKLLKATTEV